MSQLAAESRSRLRASSRVNFGGDDGGDGEEWLQAKDPVKPPDQVRTLFSALLSSLRFLHSLKTS